MPFKNANEDLPPGAKPGDHVVIRPQKALPPLPPPDKPIPLIERAVPLPRPPALARDPLGLPKALIVEKPDADPIKEVARLVKLGKEAFAGGEFGLANEQFDRAIAVDRRNALPLFLKAQAEFASGRYAAAVAAIRTGLDLDTTWPASPFDPKELFGPNPATFSDQLAILRGVVAANPADATLEFLLGYELWFIGEKVEARKWFNLAEKRLPVGGPLALFK
jgi:tetratricopeptide (TPR) repeat protein